MGRTFETGNSVVATLPEGTVLEVVGPGLLEVTSQLTAADYKPGDRIVTKYGDATVVRQSSRLDFELSEDEILYVADEDPVVRRTTVDQIDTF
jgi:hypothetical protein